MMTNRESAEIAAARKFAQQAGSLLEQAASFRQLPTDKRAGILHDLGVIQQALGTAPAAAAPVSRPAAARASTDPYALSLATPNDLARRRSQMRQDVTEPESPPQQNGTGGTNESPASGSAPRPPSTEAIAARAGNLREEIDFVEFLTGIVQGTFDALLDASIRQMEAFAELVSAVAKDVDRFTAENVTSNQVRDWLVSQYPRDLALDLPSSGQPRLLPRMANGDDEAKSPVWLADYDLEGEELTEELIEDVLVPLARRRLGENRLQMLATMVLMGMNRIIVRDGSISAKLRFRAAARDKAAVDFAVSQDAGGMGWGGRGSKAYDRTAMLVTTVGVNVQTEAELKAELTGEVKINFASETLPLERFADAAQMALLQRNARTPAPRTERAPEVITPVETPVITPPATTTP